MSKAVAAELALTLSNGLLGTPSGRLFITFGIVLAFGLLWLA